MSATLVSHPARGDGVPEAENSASRKTGRKVFLPQNVVGRPIARQRYQRKMTQRNLVTKLQLAGCPISRDALANIETQRSPVTDIVMLATAAALEVSPLDLVPADWKSLVARIFAETPLCIHQRKRKRRRAKPATKPAPTVGQTD